VNWELQDVLHTFKKGHKIMVQVQSSWFPLIDRNPQTFVDIMKCDSTAFKKATHRVYTSKANPSFLKVRVVE
jgi:predicted acyl esterase